MKMILNDILALNETVKLIIDNDKDAKIDALFKFKLLGIMKQLEVPIDNFDIIRNEKIIEYGAEIEDGSYDVSKADEDSIKKFTDDLDRVLMSDVDVNIQKLKAKDVFNAGLSTDILIKLYGIMEE